MPTSKQQASLRKRWGPEVKAFLKRCGYLGAAILVSGMAAGLPPSEIRLGTTQRPNGTSPSLWSHEPSRGPITWTHDTLFEFEYLLEKPTLKPLLAAEPIEWSKDRRSGTLRLRSGVPYHQGSGQGSGKDSRTLVAQDLVESWKKLESLPSGSFWRSEFYENFKALQSRDPLILSFILKKPDPDFEAKLALAATAPSIGDSGTGPWQLDTWHPGKRAVFRANPGYSNSFYPLEGSELAKKKGLLVSPTESGTLTLPRAERLEQLWFENPQTALQSFLAGKTDLLNVSGSLAHDVLISPEGSSLRPELSAKGVRLELGLAPQFVVAIANLRTLRDRNTRGEILATLDQEFWKTAMGATPALLGDAILPMLKDWGIESQHQTRSKIHAVKKRPLPNLLVRADWVTPSVEFVPPDIALETLSERLQTRGVRTLIESHPWAQAKERFESGKTDLLILAWRWNYPSPRELIAPLLALQPNDSKEMQAIATAADRSSLSRMATLTEAIRTAAIWSPGPRQRRLTLVQPWVFGFHLQSHSQHPEKYLRIDRELRRSFEQGNH